MFMIILWLIGTVFGTIYFGSLGIDIFSEAYDSGNFVKFIVSIFFFIMIPVSSGIIGSILLSINEKIEQGERERENKKKEKEDEILSINLENERKKQEAIYENYLEDSAKLKFDAERCMDPENGGDYFLELYNRDGVEYANLVARFLDYRDAQEIFDIWEEKGIEKE